MDQNNPERIYYVKADWDEEAGVWYVTNTDVPGLVAEAATPGELLALLYTLIPELVDLNGGGADPSIAYSVMLDHLRARRAVA